jgi:hypothetical protein
MRGCRIIERRNMSGDRAVVLARAGDVWLVYRERCGNLSMMTKCYSWRAAREVFADYIKTA